MARQTIIVVWLVALAFAPFCPVEAQQPKKIPRIGFLSFATSPNSPAPQVEAFRQGLRELGYVEGNDRQPLKNFGRLLLFFIFNFYFCLAYLITLSARNSTELRNREAKLLRCLKIDVRFSSLFASSLSFHVTQSRTIGGSNQMVEERH